jgi:hypothetical protein
MILGLFLRIATLRRNQAECIGACLDDFEDVIFLRRKIVDGMAPGQAALYSASMGVTVLLTTTKSLLLYNNDFCILLHSEPIEGSLHGTAACSVIDPTRDLALMF